MKIMKWKLVPVLVIVIFAGILIMGTLRAHQSQSAFIEPTGNQVTIARSIVTTDLERRDDSIENYDIVLPEKIRKPLKDKDADMIHILLEKSDKRVMYVVDVGKGEVLIRSETEFFGDHAKRGHDLFHHTMHKRKPR